MILVTGGTGSFGHAFVARHYGKGRPIRIISRDEEKQREMALRYPDVPNVHCAFGVFLMSDAPDRALKEFERELAVQTSKALEENAASDKPKPEAVIQNNIIPGRMKKFLAENTLMGQAFVINPDLTVEAAAKEAGVVITGFVRMACGEGIEKKEEDFAAEVAKMVQG